MLAIYSCKSQRYYFQQIIAGFVAFRLRDETNDSYIFAESDCYEQAWKATMLPCEPRRVP